MPFLVDSVMSRDRRISAPISCWSRIRSLTVTRNARRRAGALRGLDPAEGRRQGDPRKPDHRPCQPAGGRRGARGRLPRASTRRSPRCAAPSTAGGRCASGWSGRSPNTRRRRPPLPAAETRRGDRLPRVAARQQLHLPRHARVRLRRRRSKRGELKRADIPGLGILSDPDGARAQARQRGGHHDAGDPRIPDAAGSADHHQGERQVARPPPRLHGLCRRQDCSAGRAARAASCASSACSPRPPTRARR